MKVIHVVIRDAEMAEDFLRALEGSSCRTESSSTDECITDLEEAIKKEFDL